MTTKELAHDLYLGLRDAFHCPDVSVSEYEGAMAYRIDKAIEAAVLEERERQKEKDAKIADEAIGDFTNGGARNACKQIADQIRGQS